MGIGFPKWNFDTALRLELIVADNMAFKLKAVFIGNMNNFNQVLNNLKIFELGVGLLLNFGVESLYFKRFGFSGSNLRNP